MEGSGYDLSELRVVQDWQIKNQLAGVEGVVRLRQDGQRMAALPCAFAARALVGDHMACRGAMTAYEFLGVREKLGIHFRPGKHELAKEDWQAILDFADQQLRGKKVEPRFDELPPDEMLH